MRFDRKGGHVKDPKCKMLTKSKGPANTIFFPEDVI